jgi:acyl-ACP thioesterase
LPEGTWLAPVPGALHRQPFQVHSFEADTAGRLAPAALCAFLQEAAGRHAHAMGVGMTHLMQDGLAWMLQRLSVEVRRWPAEQDEITVETWPTRFSGAVAERAFRVADAAGAELARAASRWAVVDLAARKAVRLTEAIRALPVGGAPVLDPGAAPGMPEGVEPLGEAQIRVGRADLDVVGHANNTRYVEWALEAIPDAWVSGRELRSLDVVFRRETRRGDRLVSRSVRVDHDRLAHELALADGGSVLATLETRWRPVEG